MCGMMHVHVGLEVTAGSSFCRIDANGCATTNGANAFYGDSEACTIRVAAAGFVNATQFDTEPGYDHVTIDCTPYSGSNGPNDVRVAAGSTFTWSSDASASDYAGWTICFRKKCVRSCIRHRSLVPSGFLSG